MFLWCGIDMLINKSVRTVLSWFHSYRTDRQRVVLNGICSDWLPVTSGVLQGSILGTLLLLVYCNDAQYYIQENLTLALLRLHIHVLSSYSTQGPEQNFIRGLYDVIIFKQQE